MAFIETPRFPESISVGSKFGPGFSTSMAKNFGGYEMVNQNWSMPLYRGDLIHGVKTKAQFDDLQAFFWGTGGMFNPFRFKHFGDYTATGAQGTVLAIDATHWQMYKTRTFGAISTAQKITKPVSGTAIILGGGSYTVDYTTGIITKLSGANPTGWTGEFDFAVRFDSDEMLPIWLTFELFNFPSLPIMEKRL